MLKISIIIGMLLSLITRVDAADEPAASVIDLSSLIKMENLVEQVADRRVVFVGETHDRYDHHLNQLAIIEGLHAKHPDLAIGLEFFQQPFQAVLDDYIAGHITEAEFLRKTEYFERWRFDYRLYRPILSYAREHGIPLLALNIEREITDQVKKGGIESLSAAQKARIPAEIDRSDEVYRSRLETIFRQHPHAEKGDFERFVDVQLLWDEGMADRAATWLKSNPQGHLVVLAGMGHLIYGSGIPSRLQRRVEASSAIVINASAANTIEPDLADYAIITEPVELAPSGKLGVFLDTAESPPKVTGFSQKSGAKKAGIKQGDAIIRIDDMPIASYADIRIALMDKAVGEKIMVEVEREALVLGSSNHTMQVELK